MAIRAVNVVDFKPPPVPEGEAPTYMRKITTNKAPNEKLPMGTVLKPTVVKAVMDWKKEGINLFSPKWLTDGSKK